MMQTQQQAYSIASQWGSYRHNMDEGQWFCCFRVNDGRPLHDEHRMKCIRYTQAQISRLEIGIAWGTVEDTDEIQADLDDLQNLLMWFTNCETIH
jgi:hypothetical protein